MSNHYHLVLHVDRTQALSWSDEEVNKRWQWVLGRKILFETSTPKEMQQRRENLYSISWLMRCLNEHIARLSNKEDDVKGKFWESRFQSQALVDEGALLACMTYVDLNPIRAGIAPTLQESEYTSIQERLKAHQQHQTTPSTLMEFQEKNTPAASRPKAVLPFSFQDYELLIDWTGRQFREDKMGYIAAKVPSLVQNTGLNPANWIKTMETSSIRDQQIFGALSKVQDWAREIKKLWLKGQKTSAWKYALT